MIQSQPVGGLLREWRQRRRMSQLDLAVEAEISSKHVSFLETGRSLPSREMLLHLAEQLQIPLREQNILLTAAGFAPIFPERALENPALAQARVMIERILTGHEPYPALAIDRQWNLVASNRVVAPLLSDVEPSLLEPPINVLRLSLHPKGLKPRIANFAEWRFHLLARVRHQIELTADAGLTKLLRELEAYPVPRGESYAPRAASEYAGIVVPLQFITPDGTLSLLSATTVFGTPIDITLAEIALETFFPANAATAEILQRVFKRDEQN